MWGLGVKLRIAGIFCASGVGADIFLSGFSSKFLGVGAAIEVQFEFILDHQPKIIDGQNGAKTQASRAETPEEVCSGRQDGKINNITINTDNKSFTGMTSSITSKTIITEITMLLGKYSKVQIPSFRILLTPFRRYMIQKPEDYVRYPKSFTYLHANSTSNLEMDLVTDRFNSTSTTEYVVPSGNWLIG